MNLVKLASAVLLALGAGWSVALQAADATKPPAAADAESAAPIDLTGYWVSVIHTDWKWRMVTPAKGDFNMVPLTPTAERVANNWDPAKDQAAGEACRAYGAAGLMRIPGRLHILWSDNNMLRVDTDAGMQTRLLRFGPDALAAKAGELNWQGNSAAAWEVLPGMPAKNEQNFGSLHVITTHLRAGYLRKNGVPYSADAVLAEDWHLMREPDGTDWLVIYSQVSDPLYLLVPFLTSEVFKREPDGSKWDPTPCSAS